MLFEVHSEVLLKGVVKDVLELSLMVIVTFNFSKSILEHTLDLMTPKLNHLLLGVVEFLLSLE
jgi:hypothetical protein